MHPVGLDTHLLQLLLCLGCFATQATAGSVNVSTGAQLLSALQSSADTIVLHNDVVVGADFDGFVEHPLPINRNITVTVAGGNTSLDAMPVLDLANKVGILQLCSHCTFALKWVGIANENRAGTGGGMTIFRGQPGSRVEWMGGVGLRLACPPTRPQLPLINSTQRSSLFPSPPAGQQLADVVNATYRGKLYVDALKVIDLSSDIVPQQLTNNAITGGYGIRRTNATRLCDHIVSQQCLQLRLPEDCIAELLAGGAGVPSYDTGPGPPRSKAAVAVPVAVGGLLVLLGAVAFILWRRHRRHFQKQPAAKSQAATSLPTTDPGKNQDVDFASMQEWRGDSRPLPVKRASSSSLVQQPAWAGGEPWQLLWSSSAPNTEEAPEDNIELGVLLGAGSFARVYKGRWSGLDVAVKVIHHDRESARNVANEVQLMLNLNHPNVVRAYYCVTKQLITDQQPLAVAQQPGPQHAGQSFSPAPAATGSSSWALSPHTPAANSFASMRRSSTGTSLPQQSHAADTAALRDSGLGSTASGMLADSAGHGPQHLQYMPAQQPAAWAALHAGGSSMTGASVLADLQPATPLTGLEAALNASNPAVAITTGTATGAGSHSTGRGVLTSSSGVGSFVQDLDAAGLPAYQRKSSILQRLYQASSAPLQPIIVGAAGPGSPEAAVSGSAASMTSTDSLKVPKSMSTLQGSAGPSNIDDLLGSIRGSANSQPHPVPFNIVPLPVAASIIAAPEQRASLSNTPSWSSTPHVAAPASGLGPAAGTGTHPQQVLPTSSLSLNTAPRPSVFSSFALQEASGSGSRGPGSGTQHRRDSHSLQAPAPSWSSSSASHWVAPSVQSLKSMSADVLPGFEGVSSRGLPAPVSSAAAGAGSGPSTVSSWVPSRGSTGSIGSQAWPLLVSPVGDTADQTEVQVAEGPDAGGFEGHLGDAGSAGGANNGGGPYGGRSSQSPVLCETWLVTELCDRGTLARQAAEWQPESREEDMLCLLHLLRDVACGLKLLKSQNVVHADLNAHNVLVASSPVARHGLVAKVADLGLSRVLRQQMTHRTTRTVGMLTHQPPELLRDGRMSPAVDIYSFGIMMVEVYTRQAAFARLRYGQIDIQPGGGARCASSCTQGHA